MIAIIAEKPSVGQEIARVVGAHEKCSGYMQGHGYIVTWAFGHLVQLAIPELYGHKRYSELPLIPERFRLVVKQERTGGKNAIDSAASRQLNVIRRVLDKCESVIAATDAGREGELIFRRIYNHIGCTLPVKRLWVSSLTEEAIERGLREMRDGAEYDNLYLAADCRAKADWLVGINASAALAKATRRPDSSLGRVQTPTLAMIASRYLEHRGFLPSDYWSLSATLGKGDALRKFRYVEDLKDKATAEAIADRLKSSPEATITKVERKTVHEQPPLLYDLTELQKECNVHHDMSAEQTLNAAQSLYEKKLISYPRTGSRYIPADVMPGIPSLLRMILRMETFAHLYDRIDPLRTTRRSVDGSKVTDHHALIITGDYVVGELTANEQQVYDIICGRMLEAFGPRCEKDTLSIEATIDDRLFRSRSVKTVSAGWHAVYNRPEEPGGEDDDIGATGVEYAEGETLTVMGHSLAKGKTCPKPLYTEATLLAAMETAGKQVTDEKAREAMMESGLGTPATRAATIETLLKREYIERSGKSLIPTERGIALYKAIKDMRIADVALTGSWEKSLADIERGGMKPETFMNAIAIYTRQITAEVLSLDLKQPPAEAIPCPKCGNGRMTIRHKIAKCDNDKCGLVVFRRFLNKELTDQHIKQLLKSGKTRLIQGFEGKAGKTFDACLAFDKNFNLTFKFPNDKPKTPKKRGSGGNIKPKAKPTSKPKK
jgi:DNA topoisomerase-3